jgi:hypothetical protein
MFFLFIFFSPPFRFIFITHGAFIYIFLPLISTVRYI